MNQLTQQNHDLLYVGSEIEKFNENRILGSFGIVKKDLNDKYNKNIFDSYKKNSGIYVWLKVQDGKKVIDAGLVRTYSTLKKLDEEFKKENCTMLLHPYAVRIPEGFWSKWKQVNIPQERINLLKEYNLIKDELIYKIDKIVLDIDTPIEYALDVLQRTILPGLRIYEGYEIGRTKSGNTRVILYLKWPLKANDVFRKQKHLERLRELYYLLIEIFHAYNLKLDRTFADRINHPIWFSFNSHFYQRVERKPGKIPFYTLYGLVKKVQKKMKYWVINDKQNLTMRFWDDRRPKRKSVKIELPAFLRNELKQYFDDDYKLTLWKKAVKSLYKGKGGRFINFILPAIGWAKYLNLNRIDVDTYLMQFLADRDINKTEKDLDIAWRHANELEFRLPDNGRQIRLPANLDLIQITEKALNFVKQASKTRQELLNEIFYKQAWLCDLVMNFLEKKGLVKSEFVKSGKRGRPSKVYTFVDNSNNNNKVNKQQQNQVCNKQNSKKDNTVHNHRNTENICLNKKSAENTKINTEQNKTQNSVQQQTVSKQTDNTNQSTNVKTKPVAVNKSNEKSENSLRIPGITEYMRLSEDEKKVSTSSISKVIYIYDPNIKQRVCVRLFTLYQYERDRIINIEWKHKVVTTGFRIPTIRCERNDCVFYFHFSRFRLEKNSHIKVDDFVFTLGGTTKEGMTNSVEDDFIRRVRGLKPIQLNFKPFQLVQFTYSATGKFDIDFITDISTMKVWVSPEELERICLPTMNSKMYLKKLASGFCRNNPKIKWHTIKNREFYAKARKISQKEQKFMQLLTELTKDKSYWYMQPKQINHETIPEEQRKQAFSKLNLQLGSDKCKREKDLYRYSLYDSKNSLVHLSINYNLPSWMPR